ncbi:MAG TPA: hypothetical protein VGE72_31725 [Azospirillum sp.]
MRPVLQRDFMPLVVGPPRSGFTLLISVLQHVVQMFADVPTKGGLRQGVINKFVVALDDYVAHEIKKAFAAHGITGDLIYNGNFQQMTGGPKWLKADQPERACFRKYLGVRGMGDFTLNTSHPRELLDSDNVVHSHEHPRRWLDEPCYAAYTKFASIRNPIGILNSSCFSINALASEYIQRFVPPERDNDDLRQSLAEYKLTDTAFFEGLATFLKRYFEQFLQVRDRFHHVMRWESLIDAPVPTIQAVARTAYLEVSEARAAGIWQALDHLNLTGNHRHNFRHGKGKVGDWRNSLVNEHLEMIRAAGLEPIITELGYEPIRFLDEADYTPYQRRVADAIRHGQILDPVTDRDLFGFAFNKSNLSSEKFAFRRHDWREHTQVERSCFADETIERDVWDAAERATERVNAVFGALLAETYHFRAQAEEAVDGVLARFGSGGDEALAARVREGGRTAHRLIDWYFRPPLVDVP